MEYFGVFWSIMEYFGVFWNTVELCGVSSSILCIIVEYCGEYDGAVKVESSIGHFGRRGNKCGAKNGSVEKGVN